MPGYAQEAGLKQANAMYMEGKFSDSINLYARLIESQPDNPYLRYNIANAYFKSNQPGRAIASYLRAFRLLPRDSDIRSNLDFALKLSGENLVPAGIPAAMHYIYYFLSANEIEGLSWIFLWIFSLTCSIYLFRPLWRFFLKTPLIFAAVLLAAAASWTLLRKTTEFAGIAVVVEPAAELRSGPGDNFSPSATLPEGRLAQILDGREDWIEIGIPKEGIKGWIKNSSLEKV